MKRPSSTLMLRLALALLALGGFAAPVEAPEPDRVVQAAGGKPSARVAPVEPRVFAAALPAPALPLPAPVLGQREEGGQRRYLQHRAWLL